VPSGSSGGPAGPTSAVSRWVLEVDRGW